MYIEYIYDIELSSFFLYTSSELKLWNVHALQIGT